MRRLKDDVRIALRGFRRTPTFVVAVLVILGLGIGMAVAMFTTFQTVLVRRLPVRDQDRIAVMWTYGPGGIELAPSAADLLDVRRSAHTMRDVAGVVHWGASARVPFREGSRTLILVDAGVTTNFFDVLGVRPLVGRLLRPSDGEPGASGALVLSYGAWRSQFGGDPAVVGKHVAGLYSQHDNVTTIVGVAPPGLDYPVGVGSWTALGRDDKTRTLVVARLAPGASADAARAEAFAIVKRLEPAWQLQGATAESFTTAVIGDVRPTLLALTAAVALLLIIACANVGTLFLVRAASRARELAVRRALGASYADLVRQLVVESAVFAAAGGALGVACAQALLCGFLVLAPSRLPRVDDLRLHGSLLGMALGVTTFAVLLFGVLPSLAASRVDLASPLRLDARSGAETRKRRSTRQWLVASQIALALVMLAGAGLLAQSLRRLETLPLGYRPEHLSIFFFAWDAEKYWPKKMTAWGEAVEQRIRAIPGVIAVAPIVVPPFVGPSIWVVPFEAEGQASTAASPAPSLPTEITGPDYFRTFGTTILRGRGFLETDREGAPDVVILSESAARRYWPDQDPIGKRIRLMPMPDSTGVVKPDPAFDWRTVVGIVPDTRFRELRRTWPMVYVPWRQLVGWQGGFAVRSTGDIGALADATRRVIREVDPTLALFDVRSMDDYLSGPLAEPRLSALLLTAFGVMALILAAVGLYGVMASTVREQTREIGIRVALGATPAIIRRAVLRKALVVAVAGTCAGLAGVLATTRLLRGLLFNTSPTDPATLAEVCALLLTISALSAYVPAHRATRIDPVRALREE